MIQRVYEGASRSSKLDKVIVATDDQRIADEVLRFGGLVQLTDPEHPSGTDRCGEVAAANPGYDVVLNIQGDEPLVDARQIDGLLEAFQDKDVQIATLGIGDILFADVNDTNRIKIVLNAQQEAMYFSRSPIPGYSNYNGNPMVAYPYVRHIGLYAYRADVLQQLIRLEPTKLERIESLEQLRWLYHGYKIRVVETDIETPNIDVPADVEFVMAMLRD